MSGNSIANFLKAIDFSTYFVRKRGRRGKREVEGRGRRERERGGGQKESIFLSEKIQIAPWSLGHLDEFYQILKTRN